MVLMGFIIRIQLTILEVGDPEVARLGGSSVLNISAELMATTRMAMLRMNPWLIPQEERSSIGCFVVIEKLARMDITIPFGRPK